MRLNGRFSLERLFAMGADSLPISLVLHTAFCRRRTWLEVNGEKSGTFQLAHGTAAHKRVDAPSTSRPSRRVSRDIRSAQLGVHGRCDALQRDGEVFRLVEHKSTPIRRAPTVTAAQRSQLALQTLCLAEEGIEVQECAVYFTDHKRIVEVDIDEGELLRAKDLVTQTRKIIESRVAPAPTDDESQCRFCSHVAVCLPDELRGSAQEKRVLAADPDAQVLHLTTQGTWASTKGGRIVIRDASGDGQSLPIERVFSLVLHGNVDVSSALIRQLSWRDCVIIWCSSSGRVYSWSRPSSSPNGGARVRQHALSESGYLPLAREFIAAKICNQATLLRRNGDAPSVVDRLRLLQRDAQTALNNPHLLGIEGEAASLYFGAFSTMIKSRATETQGFEWVGRKGRGALDPINVLLNYAYGLLTAECIRALATCGLDPHAGVLHGSSRNKPAMALDLMEEFRQPVADSAVLGVLNRGEVTASSFSTVTGVPRLTTEGRRTLVKAFEKRAQTEFRHPVYGYSVTWRRAIEVQARMILGICDGSLRRYVGVKTR